jgi:hypothetical protein
MSSKALVAFVVATAALCIGKPLTIPAVIPAFADDAPTDTAGGRYTFNKVADGFLRLDTKTGDVTLCGERAVGWACQMVPEDRAVLENEIARLRSDNAALKQDLLSRGLPLPPGVMPEPQDARSNDITIRLPNNADLDRAVTYLGQMWQRFVDAVARAQKEIQNRS